MKSGLHLAYDGPAIPVKKLMTQIAQTVQPKLFITTGTGGGIGSDVMLGDVVIAGQVRFDCKTQFKNEPWCNAVFTPSKLPAGALAAITPALTQPNASRIPNARATPKMLTFASDAIVTTDFFAFDYFNQLLQTAGARTGMRYGRCHGRQRPPGNPQSLMARRSQRIRSPDPKPHQQHQDRGRSSRADLC